MSSTTSSSGSESPPPVTPKPIVEDLIQHHQTISHTPYPNTFLVSGPAKDDRFTLANVHSFIFTYNRQETYSELIVDSDETQTAKTISDFVNRSTSGSVSPALPYNWFTEPSPQISGNIYAAISAYPFQPLTAPLCRRTEDLGGYTRNGQGLKWDTTWGMPDYGHAHVLSYVQETHSTCFHPPTGEKETPNNASFDHADSHRAPRSGINTVEQEVAPTRLEFKGTSWVTISRPTGIKK